MTLSVSAIVQQFPYLGLFVLLVLGGVGLPFPEDTTLILCGFLIFSAVIRPIPALLVVYGGVLITDLFLYYMGRKYGRMIVTHKGLRRIVSPEKLSLLEETFKRRGVLVVLLGRHLIGLRAQILLVAGVMRMPAPRFLAADAISASLTIAFMVGAGYAGGNSFQVIKNDITRIEHGVIFLAVTFLALYILYKYLKKGPKASR